VRHYRELVGAEHAAERSLLDEQAAANGSRRTPHVLERRGDLAELKSTARQLEEAAKQAGNAAETAVPGRQDPSEQPPANEIQARETTPEPPSAAKIEELQPRLTAESTRRRVVLELVIERRKNLLAELNVLETQDNTARTRHTSIPEKLREALAGLKGPRDEAAALARSTRISGSGAHLPKTP